MSQGKITMDWAAIFDIFSIMEHKAYKLENGEKRNIVLKNVESLWEEIVKQLGPVKLQQIYQSIEYSNLYDINSKTWDAVDLAESNEIGAKEVADLNTKRHFFKKKLQEKFFNSDLTEQKANS